MSNSSSRWWLLGVIVALWAIFLSVPNPELDWETEVLASAQRYMQQKTTTPLSGLVVAVTGSTSGIGLEITLILQKLGATIWAIGRNPQKLERLFGQYDNVKLVIADLMDLASVANASQHILEHSDTLDVLINNAGIGMPDKPWEKPTTKQGYDVTFGVNYLSHFLLTENLIPLMKSSSKNAKILQVSSSYHFGSDGSDLGTSNSSSGAPIASQPGGSHGFLIFRSQRKYANSKLSQILHARALQRRHEEISAVSVCPAWVGTQIGGNKGSLIHFLLSKVAFPVNGYGLSSILHALFDEESSSRGDYYVNVDLGIPIVMDYMPSWTYSALPFWDIATSIYSACLFHVQRLFVVKTTRPSSFVSYNEQLQEELYNWSKTAVSQWL